jgi:hypothetical protein
MKAANNYAKSPITFCIGTLFITALRAAELPRTIQSIKPSIVGIGSYEKTRSPAFHSYPANELLWMPYVCLASIA